ncbi:MAG: TylF/MycF/NovP-related O-methyltransferase [Chthoniobacterales bacterium]
MIPQEIYVDNLVLAERVAGLRGCVVECGVWRGGMSAGLATVLGPERDYFLFDSFEGLPPAKRIDGEAALKWQSDYASPAYFDNCTAPVSFARRAMELSGVTSFQLVEGWFDDTLVGFVPQEPIVLLRLDGDWYDSTMTCLEALFDYVIPDGLIVVDDYHIWDGCSRAVHDFLSRRSAVERIESLGNICFVKKRPQINVEKSTPGKTQSNGLPA